MELTVKFPEMAVGILISTFTMVVKLETSFITIVAVPEGERAAESVYVLALASVAISVTTELGATLGPERLICTVCRDPRKAISMDVSVAVPDPLTPTL